MTTTRKGLWLGLMLAGCSQIAGLGEERSQGIDAGKVEDAGADVAPEAEAEASVDASADLLLHVTAEEPGEDCTLDNPLLSADSSFGMPANCGYQPALVGQQSVAFSGDRTLLCDPCWQGRKGNLWVEAVVQLGGPPGYYFDPIMFLTDAYGAVPPAKRRTGVYLDWSTTSGLAMRCAADHSSSGSLSTLPDKPYVLTVHFDWVASTGETWLRPADGTGHALVARGTPDLTILCPSDPSATGWYAASFMETASVAGTGLMDEIRIATNPDALDNP